MNQKKMTGRCILSVSPTMATQFITGLNSTTLAYSGVPAYTTARVRSRQQVVGISRFNISKMPCELAIGMIAPERNIWVIASTLTILFAVVLLLISPVLFVEPCRPAST